MGWEDILHSDKDEHDEVASEISLLHMLGHLVGNTYERTLVPPNIQSAASSSLELGIHLAREYPELTEELVSGLNERRRTKGIDAARSIADSMDRVRDLHAKFLRDVEEGKI